MSMSLIRSLEEARSRVWHQAKDLLDTAEARGSGLSGADEAAWKRLTDELGQYDDRIKDLQAREARNREAEGVRREFPGLRAAVAAGDGFGDDAELVRSFLTGGRRTLELDLSHVRTTVDRAGAWETRDLLGYSGAGANVVPRSFYAQLVEHMVQMAGIRQTNATVLTTDSGEALDIPKTTALSTAAIVAEGDAIAESDPTFAKTTLGSYKYSLLLQASSELVEDSGIDLASYFARETGQALGLASGAHFIAGDGSNKPQGIVGAASVGKTGATAVAGAFTADDLIDLFYSVIPPYRANGFWLMNDATAAAVRKLKDPGGDHYLWEQSLTAGTPNQLLGRPVVIDPNVPAIAATARSVIFGDCSRYYIRDVRGLRFERSDDFAFANDLVTWRAILRTDGDLVDTTGAVKAFAGGAAS